MESNESKPTVKKRTTRGKKRGLGDTIEAITEATGIKAAVDWFSEVTGIDCGCEARKQKLNEMFSYKKVECLTKEEYDWITKFLALNTSRLDAPQQLMIATIHARVFNHTFYQPCTCSPKNWQQYINDLKKVWVEYTPEQL
jgi:hypothetical protein